MEVSLNNRNARVVAWGLCGLAILGAGTQTYLWAKHLAETPTAPAIIEIVGLRVLLPITFSTLAALIDNRSHSTQPHRLANDGFGAWKRDTHRSDLAIPADATD